jgi:hypothetical protein
MGHESSVITEQRYVHLFERQRTDGAVRQAMASALIVASWWKGDAAARPIGNRRQHR